MKITFEDYEHGTSLELEPETADEVAQLLRFVVNSKAQRPSINLFYSKSPRVSIWQKKIDPKRQKNYLSNR